MIVNVSNILLVRMINKCSRMHLADPSQGVIPRFAMTPTNQETLEGDTVLLYCAANGRDRNGAVPVITWLKDGATISLG